MTSRAPDRTVKLLIAEDSSLFADAIVGILEEDPAIRVVGVAKNGEQALAMTESLRPDVVLMDVFMPVLDGLTAVQAIMAKGPTPIVVMTAGLEGPAGSLAFVALSKGAADKVRAKIAAMVKAEGLDLDEVMGRTKKARGAAKTKVKPKYRNPADPSQQWSGRGRQPLWFVAAVKAGKKDKDLLIR